MLLYEIKDLLPLGKYIINKMIEKMALKNYCNHYTVYIP